MHEVGTRAWRRPARAEDDGILYDVFSSTWQRAVAAMPDPALTCHFLRIQYTAQERLFAARYPDLERSVVMVGDEPAGRVYLHRSPTSIRIVDLSLLPAFRGRGIARALVTELLNEAAERGRTVTLRLPRSNEGALPRYEEAGFRLVSGDDLDLHLEWTPPARAT